MRHYIYYSMLTQAGVYGLYHDDQGALSLLPDPVEGDAVEEVVSKPSRKGFIATILSLMTFNRF